MKAVRIHEHGGVEALTLEDVPLPSPGEGDVRVKIEASGVNFIDVYHRIGRYQGPLPLTIGQEAAGRVEALGPGVEGLQVGDRVAYASVQGAYAEYAVVPAWRLVAIPEGMETQLAAAALLQGMTAQYLTHSTYPIQQGETVLVHAAGGATGQLVVQMATRRGARVIGTASSEAKAAAARAAGADECILYSTLDFVAEVKRLTANAGVDVVYNSVGKDTFDKSLDCLRRRGCMVLYGQSSGSVAPIDPQVLNAKGSIYLTRPTLGHYIANRDELAERAGAVLGWMTDGSLNVNIDRTFPLSAAAEAHRYLESRAAVGKILLLT